METGGRGRTCAAAAALVVVVLSGAGCEQEEAHARATVTFDALSVDLGAGSVRIVGEGRLRVRSDVDETVVVDTLAISITEGWRPVLDGVPVELLDAAPLELAGDRWVERPVRFEADAPVICPPAHVEVDVSGVVLGEHSGSTTIGGGGPIAPGSAVGPSALPWAWATPVPALAADDGSVPVAPAGEDAVWALTPVGDLARIDAGGSTIVSRPGAFDLAASAGAMFTVAHRDGVDVLSRLDAAGAPLWEASVPCQSSLLVVQDDRVVIQGWPEAPAVLGGVQLGGYVPFLASFDAASGALRVVSTLTGGLSHGIAIGDGRFVAAAGSSLVIVGPTLAIEASAPGPAAELARSTDGRIVTASHLGLSAFGPDLAASWTAPPACSLELHGSSGGLVALSGGGALSVQSGALIRLDGAGAVLGGVITEGLRLVHRDGVVIGTWIEDGTRHVGRLDRAALEGVAR